MPLSGSWVATFCILIFCHVQIFDRLKKGVDPKLQEEKTRRANERKLAQFEKAQRRMGELVIFSCSFCLQSRNVISRMVDPISNKSLRFKTILHYLLPYPQYAFSMRRTPGEAFLIVYSIQSSVLTNIVLSPLLKLSEKFQLGRTSFTN